MDEEGPIPHVNHSLLQRSIRQAVRLAGEVTSIETGRVRLRTSDGIEVSVKTLPGSMQFGRYVCFTGIWTEQGVLEEVSHVNLSDNTDLQLWDQMLHLMYSTYRHLFVRE